MYHIYASRPVAVVFEIADQMTADETSGASHHDLPHEPLLLVDCASITRTTAEEFVPPTWVSRHAGGRWRTFKAGHKTLTMLLRRLQGRDGSSNRTGALLPSPLVDALSTKKYINRCYERCRSNVSLDEGTEV